MIRRHVVKTLVEQSQTFQERWTKTSILGVTRQKHFGAAQGEKILDLREG
jgi:hypothetical protein